MGIGISINGELGSLPIYFWFQIEYRFFLKRKRQNPSLKSNPVLPHPFPPFIFPSPTITQKIKEIILTMMKYQMLTIEM